MADSFRKQSKDATARWAAWHRSHGRTISTRTELTTFEADSCAEARLLIGTARHVPYAGDRDLKRLRSEALDALTDLIQALYCRSNELFDADNPREEKCHG